MRFFVFPFSLFQCIGVAGVCMLWHGIVLLLSIWYNVATCVEVLWLQSLYLSRMKNQHGHWVCWMTTSRKNGWCEEHTHQLCNNASPSNTKNSHISRTTTLTPKQASPMCSLRWCGHHVGILKTRVISNVHIFIKFFAEVANLCKFGLLT